MCLILGRGGARVTAPLIGLQELHVATREDSGVLCFHSRRGVTPRVSLECNPEIPVAPGVEHYVLDTSLDEVYFALCFGVASLWDWNEN